MSKDIKALIITLTLLLIAAAISVTTVIFISSDDATDACRNNSITTDQYRACVAVENCRSEFKDNPQLIGSCFADLLTGR